MYHQYKEKSSKLQEKTRSYFEKKVLQFPEESYIIPDFRRFSQNIVLRSPGGYSSEKDC